MIIRQVVPSLERQHGGPSRSVRALALAQAKLGHDVRLLATDPAASKAGTPSSVGALRLRIFRRNWPGRLSWSRDLRENLKADRADVVHHHALWLRTLHYAHQAARANRAPLVLSPRGMMSPWAWNHHRFRKALAARLLHPGALEAVNGWHATSEQEARDIAALGFHHPVCVAPNGVDAPSAEATAAAREHWKARIPTPENGRVALFYSRLHRKKRLMELLELWAQLSPPDWRLLIVGIPEEYSVAEVSARISALGLQSRATVHDGTAAPAPYVCASLFLLPSHDENFGLSIAEAMAAGLPVVVTDTTPWSKVNAQGFGWCVPWPTYPTALSAALACHAAELRNRGEQSRIWVLENFSWETSASKLLGFYAELRRSLASEARA